MINNKWVIYIEKRNKKKSSHPGEKCFLHSLARKQRYNFIPLHRVKSVRIRSYSEPHFSQIRTEYVAIRSTEYPSVFSPNAGKMQTRITSNTATFHAVIISKYFSIFNNTPPASWVVHLTRDFTCYLHSHYSFMVRVFSKIWQSS